ncbi:MAG: hypothetical protein HZA60_02715 [Deltaproteobacteria bacterium]|nr:hypothetical protein [Deltaproteobacteria bacterium]
MSREKYQKEGAALLTKAVEQIGERVGSLVGAEVAFRSAQVGPLTAEELADKVRQNAAVLLMESASGEGRALAVFRLPEAALFAGSLLMMPAAQIKEAARSGEMGQDMADSFNEVANIVYGGLDEVTHGRSREHGKLRNEGIQLVNPSREGALDSLWPKGGAFGAEMAISFPAFETKSAFLIVEDLLLARILGIALPAAGAGDAAQAPGPAASPSRIVLLYGKDDSIARQIREFFAGMGIEARQAENADTAVALISGGPLMIIAEFPQGQDAEVTRVCRAAGDGEKKIPVVGVANRPTRETILHAKKAGVQAFLVHPFSPEVLQTKMEPLLDSAKS